MHFNFLRCSLVFAALASLPGVALAQPTPTAEEPNFAEARRYFEQGVEAMRGERWPEALEAFGRSQELRRSAAASLNLGIALHRLGRLLEARVRLQEFLELATPAQRQAHEAEAQRLVAEANRRVGRIRVTALVPPQAAITVDGRRVTLNDAQEVTVDPGTRSLRAEATGFVPLTRPVEVGAGETETLEVRLDPEPQTPPPLPGPRVDPTPNLATVVLAPTPPARQPASPSIVTRWWFWTGIAVLAAGATVGVIVATSGADPLPGGSTNIVVEALTGSTSP